MTTYKVDLDYESFLFDPSYDENSKSSVKINSEFEYVFFLVNKDDCSLKNVRQYDKAYLSHLKNLGFKIPLFSPDEKSFIYWWGHRHDIEKEKLLNSKMTSALIGQKHGWGFTEGAIVHSVEEVLLHLQKFSNINKWIIKKPHSFSGIGHFFFEVKNLNIETLKKIVTDNVLLEPAYKRIFDIGTTFEIVDGVIKRQFMVENFNNETGRFSGGAGSSTVDKFKKYIEKKYEYSLDQLEKTTQEIASEYLKMNATSNIQIDSFIYEENNELKLYPLVEVNYRKTMGLVIQSLADRAIDADHIEWRIFTSKELNGKMDDWILLSPEGSYFKSYYRSF